MNREIEMLIDENKNLIYKIASKYSYYYNMEDLFQVGVIGLIKAYKNYKMDSTCKFTTYAYKYIFGEIIEFIKNDRTMKVSEDAIKIYKSYEKSKEFLTNKLNREVSLLEVASFMNIDPVYLENTISSCEFTVSLDASMNEDDFSLENVVGEDKRELLDDLIDLRNELEMLNENDRKLIELRYFKDYTQSETARTLGMSQVQVSRSESAILKRIKTKIAA